MKRFSADFETATWYEDRTYVWAWAVCEIGNEENLVIENSLDSFMLFCKKQKNATFYFHNLKFDGSFILDWLLRNNFKYVEDKKEATSESFTSLISDFGMFYQITVYFKKEGKKTIKATFIDSLKIIPFSVSDIAKAFGLKESKLEIDYNKPRSEFHTLTKEEKDYIKNDVVIVSKALSLLFGEKLEKMTAGSNALTDFKNIITMKRFKHYFPQLESDIDSDLRRAYKGGFTYLNPLYKEKEVGSGVVLDVNSLYPSVMYEKKLPYDLPVFYEGKYKEDKVYDLYIQMLSCKFKLKKNKIPTIQIKNDRFRFVENEYLESSNGEEVTLYLTNVDLKLFLEQYDVFNLTYICGWKFKSINGIFKDYIDKWIRKENRSFKK